MTKRLGILDRSEVMSSVMPSLKYSCSGSLLRLTNGNTAIEGLSGKGRVEGWGGGILAEGAGRRTERYCTPTMNPPRSTMPIPARAAGRGRWARCSHHCCLPVESVEADFNPALI